MVIILLTIIIVKAQVEIKEWEGETRKGGSYAGAVRS